jgi:hypothetical protein
MPTEQRNQIDEKGIRDKGKRQDEDKKGMKVRKKVLEDG